MAQPRRKAPYGSWESAITSSFMTDPAAVLLVEMRIDQEDSCKDTVYWSEFHADLGQCVIYSKKRNDHVIRWTPPKFSVESKVHEYGGGSFFVCDRHVYFCNAADQRIYRQAGPLSSPVAVTQPSQSRYADGYVFRGFIFCVEEDHAHSPPSNSLTKINVETGEKILLSTAADFYASPKISPNGKMIAWIQWNLPNMPWDNTELWVAELDASGNICACTAQKVADGTDVNFMQPRFSSEQQLFYISDKSGFWNLYTRFGLEHNENVHPIDKEAAYPPWNFAQDTYSFDPSSRLPGLRIAIVFDENLYVLNAESKVCELQPTTFAHHKFVSFALDHVIYCLASDPLRFPAIIRWDVDVGEVEVIRESRTAIDANLISVPKQLSFATGPQPTEKVYVNFYAPLNPGYVADERTLPPLVLMPHSGPTSRTCNCLDLRVQYYTSRGFAVATVDYRGSSGYGKAFRDALKRNYGVYDWQDCCSAARSLVERRMVDPKKLCITGRSSGGYVVLCALTSDCVFQAGSCHYGICDLPALQEETHKFEAGYNELLIGSFKSSRNVYDERSPMNHVDRLKTPVMFFHGADDRVVPPQQTVKFFDVVKANNVPTALKIFEKEGHGYRIPENIRYAIDAEYFFFCAILNIKPFLPEDFSVEIFNLPSARARS